MGIKGAGVQQGNPDPFAAAIGFVPTLVDYLQGSIPPSDRSLGLQHKGWLAGFAAVNAVE